MNCLRKPGQGLPSQFNKKNPDRLGGETYAREERSACVREAFSVCVRDDAFGSPG
jgi:hypothetical protein